MSLAVVEGPCVLIRPGHLKILKRTALYGVRVLELQACGV